MCQGPLKSTSTSFGSSSSSENSLEGDDTLLTSSKTPPGGFQRHQRWIEVVILLMSTIYGTIYYINPDIAVNPTLCSSFDTTTMMIQECRRPDLIAYKVVALLSMITMGSMGIYHWHFTSTMKYLGSDKATPEDRLFGSLPASNYINVVIFCYQLWDFVVSLTIPEHLDVIFLIHHLLALLTAYCSLEYQMVAYYSIFYGGCSEFSSIFLIFLDKQKVFLIEPGSGADVWVQICQVLFFLTFTYYRILGWIGYSIPLWRDCNAVIASGSVEKHRPGKAYFLRLFQGLDFALGALQCFWYSKILGMVASIVMSK